MSVTFIPHLDSLERYVTVHAIKALRVSRGTAPLILNLSTRWTWVVNFTPWPFHPRERKPIPTRLPQSLSGLLDNKKSHLRRFFLILLYSVRISSTIDYLSWFFLILPFLSSRTTHNKQTSIPPTGFETAIPASDRPQTLALDRLATGIGALEPWTLQSGRYAACTTPASRYGNWISNNDTIWDRPEDDKSDMSRDYKTANEDRRRRMVRLSPSVNGRILKGILGK